MAFIMAKQRSRSLAAVVIVALSMVLICWNGVAQHDRDDVQYSPVEDESQSIMLRGEGDQQQEAHRRGLFGSSSSGDFGLLRQKFQTAKARYLNQLKIDYGDETMENMFMYRLEDERKVSMGRVMFQSPSGEDGPSWDRMKRKLVKKILQAQLGTTTADSSRNNNNNSRLPFVWATGGHSSAAGHGNYYNESYTAVMGRNAKDMFSAVGLELEARNYAMGGTGSGKEVASCTKEIFGTDMDILSWDFGMLDGKGAANFELYFHRASLSPSRPACIGLQLGVRGKRREVFRDMEQRGLTTLTPVPPFKKLVKDAIPDTADLPQDEIPNMPKFVQSFICGGAMEKGEPTCSEAKWTKNGSKCDTRPYKTSWHGGWKWHALQGNLMALFLMEVLDDALQDILARGSDPALLLQEVQQQEDADYQRFATSGPPLMGDKMFKETIPSDISVDTIYKSPNVCHTARLPSRTRYIGALTDHMEPDGNGESPGPFNYDTGLAAPDAETTPNPEGSMRLVYNPQERHQCMPWVGMDYKDWFLVHGSEQESKIILPNAAEKKVYMAQQKEPLKGIIGACFRACNWGKCPKNSIQRYQLAIEGGHASMYVNGAPVGNMTYFGDCSILQTNTGGHIWKPNANGQFEITAKVHNPDEFMRFSAFMIW